MENNLKKWIKWAGMIIAVLAVAGGAWSFYKINWPPLDFDPENFNELIKNAKSPEQIVEYTHLMQEAYKNDPYGGATPEETLNLFVEALKKGDTDLASRYFAIDKRKEMAQNLIRWKENGSIEKFLNDYKTGQDGQMSDDKNGYTMHVWNKEKTGQFLIELGKVPQNNKWLIKRF